MYHFLLTSLCLIICFYINLNATCPANPWASPPVIDDSVRQKFIPLSIAELTRNISSGIDTLVITKIIRASSQAQQEHLDIVAQYYWEFGSYLSSVEKDALKHAGYYTNTPYGRRYLMDDALFIWYWNQYTDRQLANGCPIDAFNLSNDSGVLASQWLDTRAKVLAKLQTAIDEETADRYRQLWAPFTQQILDYLRSSYQKIDQKLGQLSDQSIKVKTLQIMLIDSQFILRGFYWK
ncbi:uncharacterized protein LOC128953302 isoform X2 [Oppia nitens]|uniref:uncharacterized protein LOC128953302 isoform X2 n=1 Tax=Oppia nitens TaxID=1686743 RepID=UPI0023DB60DE|nr:uncharacterized protein LOC128953302 isoform X2 [Oppia nitens]